MSSWSDFVIALGGAPVAGGIISGGATIVAAGVVTWRLNRGLKRTEFAFAFTERFHNILSEKHKLNKEWRAHEASWAAMATDKQADKANEFKRNADEFRRDAEELYRRLFGLLFDEYYAYQRKLLDRAIFTEWMKWRLEDFKGSTYTFDICGISYEDGWKKWRNTLPLREHEFPEFLDTVQQESKNYKDVTRAVRRYGSKWSRILRWWRAR